MKVPLVKWLKGLTEADWLSFAEDKHTEPVLSLSLNQGGFYWTVNDTRQILVLPNAVPLFRMHLMLAELSGQRLLKFYADPNNRTFAATRI